MYFLRSLSSINLISTQTRCPVLKGQQFANYSNYSTIKTIKTLPFKIDKTRANELFVSENSLFEHSPKKSSALFVQQSNPIKECFVPFHSVGLDNIMSTYVGQYGIDRIETYTTIMIINKVALPVQQTRIVTDWHRVSGTIYSTSYPFGTKWSQIYAGFIYPRTIMEKALATNDVDDLCNLTKEMTISGETKRIVYPHEMNISFALEKINGRLHNVEKKRIKKYLRNKYNADRAEIFTLDVNLDKANISFHSYYIPAYVYQSELSSRTLKYKVINAYNGNILENKIYSIVKTALFGAGLGGLVTFAFGMATRPYLIPIELAFRVILGSSCSGFLFGAITEWYNLSNDNDNIKQMDDDQKNNTEYIETDDDTQRRKYSAFINENMDYDMVNGFCLPIDKLKLLQLDRNDRVTLDTLKNAYYVQIKKWHPDTHSNKQIAEKMTVQINLAYEELKKIIINGKN